MKHRRLIDFKLIWSCNSCPNGSIKRLPWLNSVDINDRVRIVDCSRFGVVIFWIIIEQCIRSFDSCAHRSHTGPQHVVMAFKLNGHICSSQLFALIWNENVFVLHRNVDNAMNLHYIDPQQCVVFIVGYKEKKKTELNRSIRRSKHSERMNDAIRS